MNPDCTLACYLTNVAADGCDQVVGLCVFEMQRPQLNQGVRAHRADGREDEKP